MLYNNIMIDQVPVSQKSLHEHAIQCHVVRFSMRSLVYYIVLYAKRVLQYYGVQSL